MNILEKVGFAKHDLPRSLRSITVDPHMRHYPANPHTDFPSAHWCRDEFVPPLSNQEFKLYRDDPMRFRRDLLRNLKRYLLFCRFMGAKISEVKKLPHDERLIALLSLLFLFQSAMDHHHYHFDYYLDLPEYPKSPVGRHYLRMKRTLTRVAKRTNRFDARQWVRDTLLELLSKRGRRLVKRVASRLTKAEAKNLSQSYQALQIYQKVQQEEYPLFTGANNNSAVFVTGFLLWKHLQDVISKTPHFVGKKRVEEILKGDPIIGTRKLTAGLSDLFPHSVAAAVQQELGYWVNVHLAQPH